MGALASGQGNQFIVICLVILDILVFFIICISY